METSKTESPRQTSGSAKAANPPTKLTAKEQAQQSKSGERTGASKSNEAPIDFQSLDHGDGVPKLSKAELSEMASTQFRYTVNAGSEIPVEFPLNPLFSERAPVLQLFRQSLYKEKLSILEGSSSGPVQVAECGVYRGRCTRAMFEIADEIGVDIELTGLDTFGGLPKLSERDLELAPPNAKYLRQKVFADTTESEVYAYVGKKFAKKLNLVKGEFQHTLPSLEKDKKYAFVFIDCDLYEGHKNALSYFYKKMTKDGIIFLDDYFSKEYPMAKVAVDEYLADKQEEVFEVRYGPYPWSVRKAFLVRH
ncbi:MAG: TylF/MycF/NovP-related O-methyltransferase [Pseudomonadota bacterium]